MVVQAPMFTRAALTIMVTMAMDIMVMVVAASSMLTGPTLPMELMLLTPTKKEIVHMKNLINKYI